jgi:membrane fusion protein, copper/silver efflux system
MKVPLYLKIIVVVVLVVISALTAWFFIKQEPVVEEEAPAAVKEEAHEAVTLSSRARKLAQVEVAPVERAFKPHSVRLYGRIDYDETTEARITAWVPGRIEKLYVNFTGMDVDAGEPMADFYSPQLIVAQKELLESLKSYNKWKNTTTSFAKDQAERNLESARTKLRLWGLLPKQIEEIESKGEIREFVTIYSPSDGVAIEKNVLEGDYVEEGTELFRIADLNKVWGRMEAFESDLPWLKLGQEAVLTIGALPGVEFKGRISFIDPFVNETTRTASVRAVIDNEDRKLKPGMYATAVVASYITAGGEITDKKPVDQQPPLIIPSTAPLITGKRAIVYVQDAEREGEYHLREITLGPRLGDYYVVLSGLEEGELVVTKGNFMIDSAAQIKALPSMMMPEGGVQQMEMHH